MLPTFTQSRSLHSFIHLFIYLFIYLFMAVLGLRFCARAFPSRGKRGPLFIAVRGPLTIAASLVAERRLQTRRLSNCGSWAQSLRGTWDPPRPGLEPLSPALAGGFSTTAPPGKPTVPSILTLRQPLRGMWHISLPAQAFILLFHLWIQKTYIALLWVRFT